MFTTTPHEYFVVSSLLTNSKSQKLADFYQYVKENVNKHYDRSIQSYGLDDAACIINGPYEQPYWKWIVKNVSVSMSYGDHGYTMVNFSYRERLIFTITVNDEAPAAAPDAAAPATDTERLCRNTPSSKQDYFIVTDLSVFVNNPLFVDYHGHIQRNINTILDRIKYGVDFNVESVLCFLPDALSKYESLAKRTSKMEMMRDEKVVKLFFSFDGEAAFQVGSTDYTRFPPDSAEPLTLAGYRQQVDNAVAEILETTPARFDRYGEAEIADGALIHLYPYGDIRHAFIKGVSVADYAQNIANELIENCWCS